MIKPKMMRWARRVAHIKGKKCVQNFDREICMKETMCETDAWMGI
jgi:hypothetical protein